MIRALAIAVLALSMPVLAKDKAAATPQNHQCMKDGAVIQKTKKECAKEGGKWEAVAAKPAETKPAEEEKTPDAKK